MCMYVCVCVYMCVCMCVCKLKGLGFTVMMRTVKKISNWMMG